MDYRAFENRPARQAAPRTFLLYLAVAFVLFIALSAPTEALEIGPETASSSRGNASVSTIERPRLNNPNLAMTNRPMNVTTIATLLAYIGSTLPPFPSQSTNPPSLANRQSTDPFFTSPIIPRLSPFSNKSSIVTDTSLLTITPILRTSTSFGRTEPAIASGLTGKKREYVTASAGKTGEFAAASTGSAGFATTIASMSAWSRPSGKVTGLATSSWPGWNSDVTRDGSTQSSPLASSRSLVATFTQLRSTSTTSNSAPSLTVPSENQPSSISSMSTTVSSSAELDIADAIDEEYTRNNEEEKEFETLYQQRLQKDKSEFSDYGYAEREEASLDYAYDNEGEEEEDVDEEEQEQESDTRRPENQQGASNFTDLTDYDAPVQTDYANADLKLLNRHPDSEVRRLPINLPAPERINMSLLVIYVWLALLAVMVAATLLFLKYKLKINAAWTHVTNRCRKTQQSQIDERLLAHPLV